MTAPLFETIEQPRLLKDGLSYGTAILNGFALEMEAALIADIRACAEVSPFRHMVTPGGFRMSVALTNCGALGWITDRRGYRYSDIDPGSGIPWPAMPASFLELAKAAANAAGFSSFQPDACLMNRYEPGARLTLHQDKNEKDFSQPIVSVSLGLPATFLLGSLTRSDTPRRIRVEHGDIAVWGGPARLIYHGVAPLREGIHPLTGPHPINLTFRHVSM